MTSDAAQSHAAIPSAKIRFFIFLWTRLAARSLKLLSGDRFGTPTPYNLNIVDRRSRDPRDWPGNVWRSLWPRCYVASSAGQFIERLAGCSPRGVLGHVAGWRIGRDFHHTSGWRKSVRIGYFVILRIS
jgi:hypothetical protein